MITEIRLYIEDVNALYLRELGWVDIEVGSLVRADFPLFTYENSGFDNDGTYLGWASQGFCYKVPGDTKLYRAFIDSILGMACREVVPEPEEPPVETEWPE